MYEVSLYGAMERKNRRYIIGVISQQSAGSSSRLLPQRIKTSTFFRHSCKVFRYTSPHSRHCSYQKSTATKRQDFNTSFPEEHVTCNFGVKIQNMGKICSSKLLVTTHQDYKAINPNIHNPPFHYNKIRNSITK